MWATEGGSEQEGGCGGGEESWGSQWTNKQKKKKNTGPPSHSYRHGNAQVNRCPCNGEGEDEWKGELSQPIWIKQHVTGLLKLPCLRLVILLQPGDAEKGGNVVEEWRGGCGGRVGGRWGTVRHLRNLAGNFTWTVRGLNFALCYLLVLSFTLLGSLNPLKPII